MSGSTPEQKPSKYEKILSRINAAKWNDYKARGKPVIQAANFMLSQLGSETEEEQLAGRSIASVEQSIGNAAGIGGGDAGLDADTVANRELTRGNARAGSATQATVTAADRKRAGLETVIARGRDTERQGIQGLSAASAADDIRSAGEAKANQTESAAWGNFAGTLAGIGLSAATGPGGASKAAAAAPGAGGSSPALQGPLSQEFAALDKEKLLGSGPQYGGFGVGAY